LPTGKNAKEKKMKIGDVGVMVYVDAEKCNRAEISFSGVYAEPENIPETRTES
jgi:hypothetical protein